MGSCGLLRFKYKEELEKYYPNSLEGALQKKMSYMYVGGGVDW